MKIEKAFKSDLRKDVSMGEFVSVFTSRIADSLYESMVDTEDVVNPEITILDKEDVELLERMGCIKEV